MAVHASHAALPYPIKNARFSILVPLLDADGDPTAQTTPDTEISEDNAAAGDAAEEVSATSGMDGMGLITFTGAETDCSSLAVNFKAASGPKATLATLYPRHLAVVGSGTLSAGSAGGGTLGTVLAYDVTGCFIRTTGGTGGGGTGGANNQARRIITYVTSTGAFTVSPNWETTPSTDTTYDVLLPEGVTLGMLRALNPTTPGRTLTVESDGMGHADVKEVGGTTQTAGDIIGDTNDIQSRLPAALTGDGNMKVDVLKIEGSDPTDTINAQADLALADYDGPTHAELVSEINSVQADIAALPTAAQIATAVWAAGTRTLTSFGTLVADIWAGVTQAFYAKFFTQDSGETFGDAIAGSVVKEIADNAGGGTPPTVEEIADEVQTRTIAAVTTVGSVSGNVAGSVGSVTAKVTPIDVDGLTHAKAMEILLALVGGVAVPSGSSVAFKKRDGTTTTITVTYGATDGERTDSVIA